MPPLVGVALSVLPALAEWLGGPRAGEAGERMAGAVRAVTGTVDPAQAAAALADPAKYLELQLGLAQIHAQERQAYLADLQHAREQTRRLAEIGSPIAWGAPILSLLISASWCWAMIAPTLGAIPVDDLSGRLLDTAMTGVIWYWIGSSQGSKRSGDAVREIAQRAMTSQVSTADALNARQLEDIRR